jgi:hypothetical protein
MPHLVVPGAPKAATRTLVKAGFQLCTYIMTYDVLGSGVANVRWVCGMEPISQVDGVVELRRQRPWRWPSTPPRWLATGRRGMTVTSDYLACSLRVGMLDWIWLPPKLYLGVDLLV